MHIIATPWFHLCWPEQPNSNSNSSSVKLQPPPGPCTKIPQQLLASQRSLAPNNYSRCVSMGHQVSKVRILKWDSDSNPTTCSPSIVLRAMFFDARGVWSVRRFCCTTRGRIPALQQIWGMDGMGYSLPSIPGLGLWLGDLCLKLGYTPKSASAVAFERRKLWSYMRKPWIWGYMGQNCIYIYRFSETSATVRLANWLDIFTRYLSQSSCGPWILVCSSTQPSD